MALNGSAMRWWADPTSELLVEFILIVVVQTAAIGVGIVLTARSEPEERKREELVEGLASRTSTARGHFGSRAVV